MELRIRLSKREAHRLSELLYAAAFYARQHAHLWDRGSYADNSEWLTAYNRVRGYEVSAKNFQRKFAEAWESGSVIKSPEKEQHNAINNQ